METLQERTHTQTTDTTYATNVTTDTSLEAQRHNSMIAERFERLKNLQNAQQAQCQETQTVQASAVTVEPVRTVYESQPTVSQTPVMQQTPQITEYSHETVSSPVFTSQRFDVWQQNAAAEIAATVVQPTYIAPTVTAQPVTPAKTQATEQYSLSTFAKIVMAVFAAVVIAMITLICANSALINRKTVELEALQAQKAQLVQEYDALRQEIEAEISQEAIYEYALENGMVLGN